MTTEPLPERPSLDHLRGQSKDLKRAVLAGDAGALAHAVEHVPGTTADGFTLSRAHAVIARHYGFPSWPKLRAHVLLGRWPDEVEPCDDPADEVLRLACLNYWEGDHPVRWKQAAALLNADPTLASRAIHVAAVAGDVEQVRRFLAADPKLVTTEGGPFRWVPLLYVTYARIGGDNAPAITKLLLDAGADPNARYLWHGEYPFTALTGVFGEGEQGPVRQPRHPAATELAPMLLEAGADPNDLQSLYNRMFEHDNDHLELLFRYGLDDPELLRYQLRWAVTHGTDERIRLLLDHGVDVTTPFDDGRSPAAVALVNGATRAAGLLVAAGAPPPELSPVDAFVAAAMNGDRDAIDPNVVEEARQAWPGLLAWAASCRRIETVRLLLELGWNVNALGRGDGLSNEPWETALHQSVQRHARAMAELLLERGADPNVRDARFDSTPLDWARHLGEDDLVDLLEPLTADG